MPYATVADARAEGVPVSIVDATIQTQLDRWSKFIDEATHQWFEPRTLSLLLDGNDSRTLFLPVPIISLTSLFMNANFTTAVSPALYAVYSSQTALRDDRRNPMIKLAQSGLGVFDAADFRMGSMFVAGAQNQQLNGSFGFVEADGTTPALIKRAVLKLSIKELIAGGGKLWNQVSNGPFTQGTVTSETTDGHSITYNAFQYKPIAAGLNGITNDAEVDNIIVMYRSPLKITSTVGRGGPDRRW
jgi:hypothetical protein